MTHTNSVEAILDELKSKVQLIYLSPNPVAEPWACYDATDVRKALTTLQATQSQQVEEAVKREQQRIIDFLDNEENQTKSRLDWPYGWALNAVRKFITPNHQN